MIDVAVDRLSPGRKPRILGDLSLPYFQQEFANLGTRIKQEQREKVLRFIMDGHDKFGISYLKFFGFPGAEWTFENMVWNSWHRTKPNFVGIERSLQVMAYAVRFMPGATPMMFGSGERVINGRCVSNNAYKVWPMANGEITGWKNNHARYIHFWAEHFWLLQNSDMADVGKFKHKFYNWTCAWIDPFGPLYGKFFDSLYALQSRFNPHLESCPLAISFAVGHDHLVRKPRESALDCRVRHLLKKLSTNWHRTFEVVDVFSHRRNRKCITMGTVMGYSKCKEGNHERN